MQLVNVIKPTHICNLNCTYCYNDDVRDPVMRPEVLERTIDQSFRYARSGRGFSEVDFIWHGGEPTVPGLDFYRTVISLQERYAAGVRYKNSIQTNGVLLNEAWCAFLREHDFGVSISIDGPKAINDRARVDYRGRGSFDRVMKGIDAATAAGLKPGVCIVISKLNIAEVGAIFDFLLERRLPFNVIPLNRSGNARENYADVGLDAGEYGDAWIALFDRWFSLPPEDYVYVQDFVLKVRAILFGRAADCIGMANCSNANISTDPMGDVYPCASLSGHTDTKYGNLMERTLEEIMVSPIASSYRTRQIDPHCASCKWQHVCHGGCPARSYKFFHDHNRRDYYCPSLFKIYEHIEKRLEETGVEIGNRHPAHMNDGLPLAQLTL